MTENQTKLVELEARERDALFPLRASIWHSPMTPQQYVQRNERLFAHPYGKEHIRTYGLQNAQGEVVSSLDTLEVNLAVSPGEIRKAYHVASFVTEEKHRKMGYGSQLFRELLQRFSDTAFVLFSDIDPDFYVKLGFKGISRGLHRVPSGKVENVPPHTSITAREFSLQLKAIRLSFVADGVAALLPSEEWLDWHLERFRYFAELTGRPVDSVNKSFWRVQHPQGTHLLAGLVDPIGNWWDVWWADTQCADCLNLSRLKAHEAGVSTIRYWSLVSDQAIRKENPMVYVPGLSVDYLANAQPCDYW